MLFKDFQKKSIGSVVATALLLVVAVVTVMGFQNWFQTYQSNINFEIEESSSNNINDVGIETVMNSILYFQNSNLKNLTLIKVEVDDYSCNVSNISLNLGINKIDLGFCILNAKSNIPNFVVLTNNGIYEKKIYLDDIKKIVFLPNFEYYKKITIVNDDNVTFNKYSLNLKIDTNSLISQNKLNSDCLNLNFYDSNYNKLNFWFENDSCNLSNTNYWVEISNLNANSSKDIYMYYGGDSNSILNPKNVFLIFDDFNIYNTSKWTYSGTGSVSLSNGNLVITGADGGGGGISTKYTENISKGFIKVKAQKTGDWDIYIYTLNGDNFTRNLVGNYGNYFYYETYINGNKIDGVQYEDSNTNWNKYETNFYLNKISFYKNEINVGNSSSGFTFEKGFDEFRLHSTGSAAKNFDWILVGYYSSYVNYFIGDEVLNN